MQKKPLPSSKSGARLLRPAVTMSVALLFLLAQVTSSSSAVPQKSKTVGFGGILIVTRPGTYPVLVDGSPAGKTNAKRGRLLKEIKLEIATHTIEILFPNHQRWKTQIDLTRDPWMCLDLHYTPAGPGANRLPPVLVGEHPEGLVDIAFPDGARLVGGFGCYYGSVPNVSLNKKKRKSNRKK